MPKSKWKVPSGWDDYSTIREQVRGTPFICFKTPLQPSFGRSWGIPELLDACPKLAMVIDMTDTDRYYSPEELQDLGVGHQKLRVPGAGQVPNEHVVGNFFAIVDKFLESSEEGQFLGIHCTHGLNRTGYLVCCYLIDRLGLTANEAIAEFNKSRGEVQDRKNYLEALRARRQIQ